MPEAVLLDPDHPDTEAVWQDLWVRASQHTPFTHLAFVRAAATATRRRAHLAVVREADRLVAGCVLYTKPGGRIAAPAPLTRYSGVLLDPVPHERHILQRQAAVNLLADSLAAHFTVTAVSLAPTLPDVRAFQWAGFRCEPRYTYRIAAPYRPARSVTRRMGEMAGPTIAEVAPEDPAFNRLLQAHYASRGTRSPVSLEVQAQWLGMLAREGLARCVWLLDDAGVPAAALVTLQDDRVVYTWLAGSVPGPALTRLQHLVVEEAVGQGLTVDLLGANHPSIAFFKAGFGGMLTPHYHAVRYGSRLMQVVGALRPLA